MINFLTHQYFDAKWAWLAIGTMVKDQKIDSLFDSFILKVVLRCGNFSSDKSDCET